MIPVLLLLSFAPETCRHDDHHCQAERYVALSDELSEAGDRSRQAQRPYLLADALARKPPPQHLVDRFRSSAETPSAREREIGVECKPRKKATMEQRLAAKAKLEREGGPAVNGAALSDGGEQTPATVPACSAEKTALVATAKVNVVEPRPPTEAPSPSPAPNAGAAQTSTQGPEPAPGIPFSTRAPASRKHAACIGGGVTLLLAGGALAGVMAGILVKRGELTQTFRGLVGQIEGEKRDATVEEYARARQLNSEYRVLTAAAGVTGTAAALGIIGGAILLRKQTRRVLALPWSGPHAAGLTLRGRF